MALIESWLPPSREHWELVCRIFQFFPLVTILQWTINWYGMGKTSVKSRLNFPGKIGWITMEAPGFITLLYTMSTLPAETGIEKLPWQNKTMAALFTIHYLYRAILSPLISPSMSPIHIFIWIGALLFQLFNSISLGGWLGGHGPTTGADWASPPEPSLATARMLLGLVIWAAGFFLTVFHDDELREIRRAAAREQLSNGKAADGKAGIRKVYVIPKNGLFSRIFYPHYLFEWIEWAGFWVVGGASCVPARTFLINEITTMLPRALQGKRWYVERFGKEKVAGRKAIIPGIF